MSGSLQRLLFEGLLLVCRGVGCYRKRMQKLGAPSLDVD